MPCPYAEKKGPVVYCKVAGKRVNPLAFPCLSERYTKCKYYRSAKEKEAPAPAPQAPSQAQPQPAVQKAEQVAATPTAKPGPRGEVKGVTLDGRKPRTCHECIYFGSHTKTCLLLGIDIDDPNDPPCART